MIVIYSASIQLCHIYATLSIHQRFYLSLKPFMPYFEFLDGKIFILLLNLCVFVKLLHTVDLAGIN